MEPPPFSDGNVSMPFQMASIASFLQWGHCLSAVET